MQLGPVGVWWSGSWEAEGSADVAAELEALGYGAIWSSGGFKAGLSSRFSRLLGASSRIVVASGIVSIWTTPPEELARARAELERAHPGRFLLGLGVSHAPLVEHYRRPYAQMVEFLDRLDAARPAVPAEGRVLAALRPRMLELAARRARGAHPYLVPAEHTARARAVLGAEALLAPELTVVLEEDPSRARELARGFVAGYLTLPNYAGNLRSLGYGDDDLAGGGSDRLLDALVAWGGLDAVARRVAEHRDAGADHVCLQVVSGQQGFPLAGYRLLAEALLAR